MLREAWTLAIEALSWIDKQKLSEPLALAKTARQFGTTNKDAIRLAQSMICEIVRRRNFLDAFINKAIEPARISEFTFGVQAFLRLYVFQTRMQRETLDAPVRQAEDIAKLGRLILGWKALQPAEPYLGKLLTQDSAQVLNSKSDSARIGLQTFHPTWFVDYCFKLFGRHEAIAFLQSTTVPPPLFAGLNALNAGYEEVLKQLRENGLHVERLKELNAGYRIVGSTRKLSQCIREGAVQVQDKACLFAVDAAGAKPGMSVLDVCCAPGVKTVGLAESMQNKGQILSLDYSRRRTKAWATKMERMGVKIATPIIADTCTTLPVEFKADIVALDPPCTNTGVFSRLPSSKWRLTSRSPERMAALQGQMLDKCSEHVKLNGSLLYSTFSITVEENEMLIEKFLKLHADFSLVEITPKIGSPGLRGLDKCRRLYPHLHESSGFFIARLTKTGE